MKTRIITGAGTGIVLLFIFLLTIPESCYRKFYKVADNSGNSNVDSTIEAQAQQNKYLILHSGDDIFHMRNVVVNPDHQSLMCTISTLPEEHYKYLNATQKEGIVYKASKGEGIVLKEVHIYALPDSAIRVDSPYLLSINKISKIEILEKDKGKTTTSTIVSTVGIAVAVGAIVAIIVSSSQPSPPPPPPQPSGSGESSCPFVSVYNGHEFITQGELYPGAVYPQLSKNDYLPLSMQPVSKEKFQLKISNEQKEVQHTDLAELMVITHDRNVQMMVDKNGKLYSVSKLQEPFAAACNQKNILNSVAKQDDDLVYAYDDTSKNVHNNSVELFFKKDDNSKQAKLIFSIRNSYWLDYVLYKWTEGYGVYYPQFVKKQEQKPAEKMLGWMSAQQIPLTVSVFANAQWHKVTQLYPMGPLSFRQIVVPIDLSNIQGNTIKVRISGGFMFWELDYAAIDFTSDKDYTVEKLLPVKATDENGKDVTAQLSAADKNYLVQPSIGNVTTVDYVYTGHLEKDKTQTFILHSKGYYQYVRNFKNAPDVKFLKQFKKPGALSNYSMLLYKQMASENFIDVAKK